MTNKTAADSLPIVETYTKETTRLNINLLYSFMLKRIAKGYSSLDVSFLMGYSFDFIKSVEELMQLGLDFVTNGLYLEALRDGDIGGILFNDFDKEGVARFELIRTTHPEQIIHEVYQLSNEDEKDNELVFKLFEQNWKYQEFKNAQSCHNNRTVLSEFLALLFAGTYFLTPKEPSSIFRRCQMVVDGDLKPYEVRGILFEMTKQKSFPKLRAKDRRDGLTFEKVFKTNTKSA